LDQHTRTHQVVVKIKINTIIDLTELWMSSS
jgi:hypothetical protein